MAAALIALVICVVACIVIHLYVLRFLWHAVWPRVRNRSGIGMAVMVLGCIVGHILEIALFAVGIYFIANQHEDSKLVVSQLEYRHLEIWYYSAAFYTSLGADKPATAGLRVFTACEALVGLILITWTASFLFLLMEHTWNKDERKGTGKAVAEIG
jgi:hypothetical protein